MLARTGTVRKKRLAAQRRQAALLAANSANTAATGEHNPAATALRLLGTPQRPRTPTCLNNASHSNANSAVSPTVPNNLQFPMTDVVAPHRPSLLEAYRILKVSFFFKVPSQDFDIREKMKIKP